MIELDLLGGRKSDKDTGSCIKAFSPRLIPSCCSVGIANSKIYIDCSLYNRPQTKIFQLPKGGPEEASQTLCNCLKYHAEEGADLLGGATPGRGSRPRTEDCSDKTAACVGWASCVWKDRSEGYVPGLHRRGSCLHCPSAATDCATWAKTSLLQMPFLICSIGINRGPEEMITSFNVFWISRKENFPSCRHHSYRPPHPDLLPLVEFN